MPFYEYQCKSCGHELEAMQKVSDDPLKKCPSCGKSQLQRLMSAPVFRLKGGGWYETDFKGDADNKRNLADKPEADAPKETAAAEKSGEPAKTEAKSDAKSGDASGGESAKSKEKPAEKSADKAVPAKPAATGAGSARGASKPSVASRRSARPQPKAKRSVSKPAAKPKARRK